MPPKSKNVPTESTKVGSLPSIPGTIRRNLGDPPRAVVPRNRAVELTSMPKATVDENHYSSPWKDNVGTTGKIRPVLFY